MNHTHPLTIVAWIIALLSIYYMLEELTWSFH